MQIFSCLSYCSKSHVLESNTQVGLLVSIPKTSYELAWLVCSSDQSDAELIAIVYDGSYTCLDDQIIFDGEDIISWNEYELKTEELNRRAEECMKQLRLTAKNRTN